MTKKVLVVVNCGELGGAEQFLKMVAKYYSNRQEYEVDVFFLKNKKLENWSDINNINTSFGSVESEMKGFFPLLMKLIKERKKYDITISSHIHIIGILGIFRFFKIFMTNRFVGRESTMRFKRVKGIKLRFYKFLYHTGYRNVDLLICQSDIMESELLKHMPHLNKISKVIPNPLDFATIQNMASERIDTSEFGDYIISAGRFINDKGFDILINAFAKIKDKNPELKLVILGEGKERSKLEALIKSLNLTEYVFLPGHKANVIPYFMKAQVCVVSSILEGFPNVLLQMMSQNSKIVSTLCAGGIENISGIITCPPGDINGLSSSLETCLKLEAKSDRFDHYLSSRDIDQYIIQLDQYQ